MSQVQVDSPSVMESVVGTGGVGSRIASPNTTMTSTASTLSAVLHLQVPPPSATNTTATPAATKRSNFSISNLLATEEEKETTESNDNKRDVEDLHSKSTAINDSRIMIQPPGSPFLNASALAHLAHIHHGSNPTATSTSSSSTNSTSTIPGWPDWLGTAGLGPDAHQSLWSR